mgnify:FL=1
MTMLSFISRGKTSKAVAFALVLVGWSLSVLPAGAKLRNLTKLAVIGDSYSDAGNSGLLTQSHGYPAFPAPYYAGGRFSNGPVAVEKLWTLFNPSLPPLKPSLSPGGSDYAVGGATSGLDSYFQVAVDMPPPLAPLYAGTSAQGQLLALLPTLTPGSFDPSSTLFVYWMGPNDGLYWLTTGKTPGNLYSNTGPQQATAIELLQNSMSNIGTGVQALINNGAQHVLVPNLMDFGKAPAFSADPNQAAAVTALSKGFNTGIEQTLKQLQAINPGVDLMTFDTYGLFEKIFAAPGSYGFNNISQEIGRAHV